VKGFVSAANDNRKKAIKRLEIENNAQGESEFLQEIALLAGFRHPNIVPLVGVSIERYVIIDITSYRFVE